jgi:hypothetical protein
MIAKHAALIGTVGAILLSSAAARAQGAAAGAPPATSPPASASSPPPPTLKTDPPPGAGDTDHEGVVSHIGVTLFPTQAIPLPGLPGVPAGVDAPVIGVRYWMMANLGIDAGLGLGWRTGSAPSPFAMAFHVGVPIALASSKHFTFLVLPEANLGFAHENQPVPAGPNNTADGFIFDIGGRVGAEIQFGFIGIPQLALQGSVGLLITHTDQNTRIAGAPASANTTSLTTTVGSTPWAIFTNAIEATYYL